MYQASAYSQLRETKQIIDNKMLKNTRKSLIK